MNSILGVETVGGMSYTISIWTKADPTADDRRLLEVNSLLDGRLFDVLKTQDGRVVEIRVLLNEKVLDRVLQTRLDVRQLRQHLPQVPLTRRKLQDVTIPVRERSRDRDLDVPKEGTLVTKSCIPPLLYLGE